MFYNCITNKQNNIMTNIELLTATEPNNILVWNNDLNFYLRLSKTAKENLLLFEQIGVIEIFEVLVREHLIFIDVKRK